MPPKPPPIIPPLRADHAACASSVSATPAAATSSTCLSALRALSTSTHRVETARRGATQLSGQGRSPTSTTFALCGFALSKIRGIQTNRSTAGLPKCCRHPIARAFAASESNAPRKASSVSAGRSLSVPRAGHGHFVPRFVPDRKGVDVASRPRRPAPSAPPPSPAAARTDSVDRRRPGRIQRPAEGCEHHHSRIWFFPTQERIQRYVPACDRDPIPAARPMRGVRPRHRTAFSYSGDVVLGPRPIRPPRTGPRAPAPAGDDRRSPSRPAAECCSPRTSAPGYAASAGGRFAAYVP